MSELVLNGGWGALGNEWLVMRTLDACGRFNDELFSKR